ncbi:hypothetical protein MPSEU_000037700 [Mayamaea pseudoterrestris]|nr:hypothetical protein MPSEU_000037700 [Mayamaea pseudoterrestris]
MLTKHAASSIAILFLLLEHLHSFAPSIQSQGRNHAATSSTSHLHMSTPTKEQQELESTHSLRNSNRSQQQPSKQEKNNSFSSRLASGGLASAAAVATAAVNAAVAMKSLEAPDTSKTYIAMSGDDANDPSNLDEEGLPLTYNKELIERYWTKERGALQKRWAEFVGKTVPFLTKIVTLWIRDGKITDAEIPALSKQARIDLQDLGATFIKLGQVMSVRPDVLPQATLEELQLLQDSVVAFDTTVAVAQIERELGGPLGQFFSSISQEPVAAASLAQVYKATLNDEFQTPVAIKVQRPNVLGTVSKDLYVLRRAAEVWQGLVDRFAPQQKTNYVALLNEWAIGFYTELNLQNEAANQRKLRELLIAQNVTGVIVPKTFDHLCTRRILVSEWIDGTKLSSVPAEVVNEVTPLAQEAFLTQLFELGFFHADPHPGNILVLNEPTPEGAKIALIDCGLMASIDMKDRDNMISAVIHLANKDYASLVDDFIGLGILPLDSDRAAIIPLMDKALSPYVQGGGAKNYEKELKKIYGMESGSMQSQVGGFQAMTQDALTVLNDIPFTIPPYFALLGRAIVTLEGIALTGDENYAIIQASYPFVARKLMREGRPEIQKALQQVLYSNDGGGSAGFKLTRLLALLNNAAGEVARQDGAAFVDINQVPENGISLQEGLSYLLSDNAAGLRGLLEKEVDAVVDVISRQVFRRGATEAMIALTPPRPPALPFFGDIFPPTPTLDQVPLPILLPSLDANGSVGVPSIRMLTLKDLIDVVAPKLDQDEEIFAIGVGEGAKEFFGENIGSLIKGEKVIDPQTVQIALQALRSGVLGRNGLLDNDAARSALQFVGNAIDTIQTGGRDSAESAIVNKEIIEALASLDPAARTRFDDITEQLSRRALDRLIQRLSAVNK